jgi:hypothetical protein
MLHMQGRPASRCPSLVHFRSTARGQPLLRLLTACQHPRIYAAQRLWCSRTFAAARKRAASGRQTLWMRCSSSSRM